MWIIRTAGKVSGGMDDGYRKKMYGNVVFEVGIGLVPFLGDLVDTFFQANTRNFVLLEAMLVERVKLADGLRKAEKVGNAAISNHTYSNGHQDGGRRTATPEGYDDRHAGVHTRLQAQNYQDSAKSSRLGGASGGWLNRLQNRGSSRSGNEDVRPAPPS